MRRALDDTISDPAPAYDPRDRVLPAQGVPPPPPPPAAQQQARRESRHPGTGTHRPVRVALARTLTPVYRAGLGAGLLAAGLETRTVAEPAGLPALLDGPGRLVVVLPSDQASLFDDARTGAPGHVAGWAAVHVIAETSAQHYAAALRCGATGVVAEVAELSEVVDVIVAAASGRTLLPSAHAQLLSRSLAGPPPRLEPRERAWLRRLADGGTVAGLARSSGYSEREMYRLLARVYARLGADSRTEALLMSERFGLLGEESASTGPVGATV